MSSLRIPEQPVPGVNFVGFLEAESGLGEVARRLAAAVDATGVPLAAIPFRRTLGRQGHPMHFKVADEAPFDVNLLSLSADDLVRFAEDVGPRFFANRYSIGLWFWETTVFRTLDAEAARFLDELWVASEFVREAIEPEVDIPIHVVPVSIEAPAGPFADRCELDLPDAFTFLFVFDFWSVERKNPEAIVRAFTRAFAPDEGPVLVLKCVNGRVWEPERLGRLMTETGDRGDILIRDGYVSDRERDSYVAACDCYVSLHRSEGWGLTMAEAMALGKPVIATAYSGNLEFMSDENSYLVPFQLVDVPPSWWAHAPGAQWAEPDCDVAAQLMRRAWQDPNRSRSLGARARADVLERFAPEKTRRFVEDRLEEARTNGAVRARASTHDPRPAILELARALGQPVGSGLASGHGMHGSVGLLRRMLLRALWPQLEEQRRVDASALAAIHALHRSVEDLARHQYRSKTAASEAGDSGGQRTPGRSRRQDS